MTIDLLKIVCAYDLNILDNLQCQTFSNIVIQICLTEPFYMELLCINNLSRELHFLAGASVKTGLAVLRESIKNSCSVLGLGWLITKG
jgi:hypothetical protein